MKKHEMRKKYGKGENHKKREKLEKHGKREKHKRKLKACKALTA